jgi:hypothetical protein
MRRSHLVAFALVLAGLSCATPPLKVSWRAPQLAGLRVWKQRGVLVVASTPSEGARRAVENGFARELLKKDIRAVPSYTILDRPFPGGLAGLESLKQRVREAGVDAVLLVQFVEAEAQGNPPPPPSGPYYAALGWPAGRVVPADRRYRLQGNLYGADSEALAWTGTSQMLDPAAHDEGVRKVAEASVKDQGLGADWRAGSSATAASAPDGTAPMMCDDPPGATRGRCRACG